MKKKTKVNSKRKIDDQRVKYLFETRKSYLDKICNFDLKIHYGFMIFFGTIIITLISQADYLVQHLGVKIYILVIPPPIL